jgi:ribonuclease D
MQARHYLERPTKDAIRELPKFNGLPLDRILSIRTKADIDFAHSEVCKALHVGFDTESKPSFVTNQPRTGPHILQVSTQHHAFLFRADHGLSNELISAIIESEKIIKVGFGLKSDRGPIHRTLGVKLRSIVELSAVVRRLGYRQQVGLQTAVAVVLGQYLQKSKKLTTSNWAANPLSASQSLYAANDAYASLCVHLELSRTSQHLLVSA